MNVGVLEIHIDSTERGTIVLWSSVLSIAGPTGSASYIPIYGPTIRMKDYILDEEQHLSPIVIGTTVVLIAAFVIGVLYQIVGVII
jgi:hypothetical protein